MLPIVVTFTLLQQVNVTFLKKKFLILNNQQRPTDSSGVGVDPDLSVACVIYY